MITYQPGSSTVTPLSSRVPGSTYARQCTTSAHILNVEAMGPNVPATSGNAVEANHQRLNSVSFLVRNRNENLQASSFQGLYFGGHLDISPLCKGTTNLGSKNSCSSSSASSCSSFSRFSSTALASLLMGSSRPGSFIITLSYKHGTKKSSALRVRCRINDAPESIAANCGTIYKRPRIFDRVASFLGTCREIMMLKSRPSHGW